MTGSPLVSILVPLHNKEDWIYATITSALQQTHDNIEVIVIDDGSTDRSAEIVGNFTDPRLRLIRREQRGANVTRNELLDLARGEFVQYLDADDLLHADKLARQVPGLIEGAGVSLCSVSRRAGGRTTTIPPDIARFSFEMLAISGVPSMSPIHRRAHLIDVGGWAVGLLASQEYDLHLRLAIAGLWQRPHIVEEVLAEWRVVPGSTSASDRRVYTSKLSVIERVAPLASDGDRRVLALVAVNTGRHLARTGAIRAAGRAVRYGLELDPGGISEVPGRLRWLRRPNAIAVAEWMEHRVRWLIRARTGP